MSGYQGRWLLIALLWSVVTVVFIYNLRSAASYEQYEKEVATIRALNDFITAQTPEIAASKREVASLSQPVESVNLGLLFLESQLVAQAHAFDLEVGEFKAEPTGPVIPVSLKVIGDYRNLSRLTQAIEGQFPYLAIQRVDSAKAESNGEMAYTILLNYAYRQEEQGPP